MKKRQRKETAAELKRLRQTYQPIKEKQKAQEDALKIFKESESKASLKRRKIFTEWVVVALFAILTTTYIDYMRICICVDTLVFATCLLLSG